MHSTSLHKDMRGVAKVRWEMNVRSSVCGCRLWLHPGDFEAKIVQEILPVGMLFVFVQWGSAKKFAWDGQALAKD